MLACDPQTDSWTRKHNIPTARRFAAAAAVDGIIYVLGGTSGSWPGTYELAMAVYNPKTDTWATKAKMPTGRVALSACVVDGIIYTIGGALSLEEETAAVEDYDSEQDRFTAAHQMPRARSRQRRLPLAGELVKLDRLWQCYWHKDYQPPAKRPGLP